MPVIVLHALQPQIMYFYVKLIHMTGHFVSETFYIRPAASPFALMPAVCLAHAQEQLLLVYPESRLIKDHSHKHIALVDKLHGI
jgi:hypothetical protein